MNDILYINTTEPLENTIRPFETSWTVYAGTLYGLTPISAISALMNLVAFFMLRKDSFQASTIFKYLRINVLNSLVISLLLMTKFTCTPYKFDYTNTNGAMFYLNHVYAPLLSIFHLNGNFLDITIILERVIKVRPVGVIKKIIKSKFFWAVLLLISLVINLPNFNLTTVSYVDIVINNSLMIRSFVSKKSNFSLSMPGKIFAYLLFIIRDFITLVIKIILNIISVILVKKYFRKLSKDVKVNVQTNELPSGNYGSTKKAYMTEIDRNLTYIAIWMSVLSSIENLFFVFTYIYLTMSFDQFGLTLYFFANFLIALKHSSNLILLYSFNYVFKKEFKNFFWSNNQAT